MPRTKKEIVLSERVMNNETIDYSLCTHAELIECIGALKTKVEEKQTAIISAKDLKEMKKNLEKVIEKLNVSPIEAPIEAATTTPTTTPNP